MSMISNLVEELIDNADLYTKELHDLMYRAAETIEVLSEKAREQEWIPCSERMPEHSYTKRFWLTVKLDDRTITTLIGTWGAWEGLEDSKSYDAFDCWKDTMINGGIYRLSQPIPKEQVLAWMPAPEPWRSEDNKNDR